MTWFEPGGGQISPRGGSRPRASARSRRSACSLDSTPGGAMPSVQRAPSKRTSSQMRASQYRPSRRRRIRVEQLDEVEDLDQVRTARCRAAATDDVEAAVRPAHGLVPRASYRSKSLRVSTPPAARTTSTTRRREVAAVEELAAFVARAARACRPRALDEHVADAEQRTVRHVDLTALLGSSDRLHVQVHLAEQVRMDREPVPCELDRRLPSGGGAEGSRSARVRLRTPPRTRARRRRVRSIMSAAR